MNQLVHIPELPQLPVLMHPIVGKGLVETDLIMRGRYESPEQAMAAWRADHPAERMPYRCIFTTKPINKNDVSVHFWLDFEGKHKQLVGKTLNDPAAVKILIANSRVNHYMSSIRWEIYTDRHCDNLMDMGRYDQWDFLLGIEPQQLRQLKLKGVVPTGNWDFDRHMWTRQCEICNENVVVNMALFNIDSVVCAKCGNRPFLAPDLHRGLDAWENWGNDSDHMQKAIAHALDWMAGVNANFGQVRKNVGDNGRVKRLWQKAFVGRVLGPEGEKEIKGLFENKVGLDFTMFKACCEKMDKALTGAEPFQEEHKIAIDFVLRTAELLRVRRLTTSDSQ